MARQVQDREDLLREATALVPRVALRLNHVEIGGEVILGFHGEALSIYFNAEPVLHFNAAGELRRAFYRGQILKAEQRSLVRWDTQRSDNATVHLSSVLAEDELNSFQEEVLRRLDSLESLIRSKDYEFVGEVPVDGDALAHWARWRRNWSGFCIASKPGLL